MGSRWGWLVGGWVAGVHGLVVGWVGVWVGGVGVGQGLLRPRGGLGNGWWVGCMAGWLGGWVGWVGVWVDGPWVHIPPLTNHVWELT